MSEAKIRTLPNTMVTGYWDRGSTSEVPERVKIVLADGTKARYVLDVEQPHPQCMKSIELIRVMSECTYGGYKPRHEKRPADAVNIRPARKQK